jgi:hypothetical protein
MYIAIAILLFCAIAVAQPYGTRVNDILVKIYHIGDYAGGNYANFDQYGRYQAVGDSAMAWGSVAVGTANVKINPATNKPDYVSWVYPSQKYSFDPDAAESLYFAFSLPHDWRAGSNLHPVIHWSPTTTDTGGCAWKTAYMKTVEDGVFAFAVGDTTSCICPGSGVANTFQHSEFTEIDFTGIDAVDVNVTGVLYRNAALGSDTYTGEAIFHNISFHYEIDSFGSRWHDIK